MPLVTNNLNALVVIAIHQGQLKYHEPGATPAVEGVVNIPASPAPGDLAVDVERYGEQWHIVLTDNLSVWRLSTIATAKDLGLIQASDWTSVFGGAR